MRTRRSRATALGLVLTLLAALCVAGVGGTAAAPAQAASTALSDFSKTGIDQTTPSTGSVGSPGTAVPGDTIKWVLSYRNNTGADASVSISDPITGGQTYVANSLQLPPNLTGSVSGNTVSASGTVLSGSTGAQIPTSTPVSINFTTPGGDGYSIENYGTNIYTVYHHSSSATTVFCSTIANTRCANWPAGQFASYVSPTAGVPIGTGPVPAMITAHSNGSFIVDGKLYWGAETTTATAGLYTVGIMCLNLTTTPAQSCGFTALDQLPTAPPSSGSISSNAIAAADGNYYFFDSAGRMLCFNPAVGACGSVDVTRGRTNSAGSVTSMLTSGNYVYTTFYNAGSLFLTCYDVSAHAICSGTFPVNEGAPYGGSAYPDTMAPVLDPASGTLLGVCDLAKATCFAPSGTTLPNPYPGIVGIGYPSSPTGFGDGLIIGTRFYAAPRNDVVTCWDFSLRVGTGAVPKCSGFTGPTDRLNYTVRALTGDLAGCGAADGDGGQIKIFNLGTGGGCNSVQAVSVGMTPSNFYCDGRPGHVATWGAVTLAGLTASDYVSARMTLTDVNGNNVPGWVDVAFPPSGPQSIDISSIPVAGTTTSLTAHVTIMGSTNPAAMSTAQLKMTWSGDPIQVCYRTTVAAVPCLTSAPVSNTATAVTTAGGVSDAPAGNSSGTVTFTVTNPASACQLRLVKTATPNPAKPGDVVSYTVTVRNTGTSAYAAANPAVFSDDISPVLTDAVYNPGSLTTSAGTAEYDASKKTISWSGPLAAGASATVNYTVTVSDPDTGPHSLVNRVVTPTGTPSNCSAGSADPACQVTVPVQSFRVVKSTTATQVIPGEVVPYTITVTNTGQVDYTTAAPASFTDDLTSVLDDASYDGNATATAGTVSYTAPTLSWTGPLAIGATVTIAYSATVHTPDLGDATLTNAVVTPPESGGNCAAGSTDPSCRVQIPEKSFSVTKTASVPVTHAGGVVTYTLTVRNTGQSAYTVADPASLSDDLTGVLDDASYRNDATASGGTVGYASPTLTWSGALGIGATVTISYSVVVHDPETADHRLDNAVTNPPESGGNCVPGSSDPACRSIVPVRAYTVVKSSPAAGTVYPGQVVPYVVTITNTGAADYTAGEPASASDDLSGVLDDAAYNGDATATTGLASYTAPVLTWSGPLAVGGVTTITYSVTLDDPDAGDGTVTNAASPTGEGGRCEDGVSVSCAPVVLQVGRYTVTKTSTPTGVVHPGDTISYTIAVHNTSRGDFTAASPAGFTDDLTAVLDDATYADDATATAGSVDYTRPVLSWSGPLPAGTTVTVTYSVTVGEPGTGDGVLTNAAEPTTPGGGCANGSAAPCPPVVADLQSFSVAKTASNSGPVHPGDTVTYTIAVRNTGRVDYTATDPAAFTDDLTRVIDDGAYGGDASASAGTLHYAAPELAWSGPLAVGATATITYTVTVRTPDPGDHILANPVVTPPGTGGDCPAGSSAASCSVTTPVLSLHVAKTASATRVDTGEHVTYTLTVTNTGAADYTAADPAALVDDMSAVLDDAGYDADAHATAGSVTYAAPLLSWSGPLSVGQTVEIVYTVSVDVPDRGDRVLRNRVTTGSDGNCHPDASDPACSTSTTVNVPAPPIPPVAWVQSMLPPTGLDGRAPAVIAVILLAAGLAVGIVAWRRRRRA